MMAATTVAYLVPFPLAEANDPLEGANSDLHGLRTLIEVAAELAEFGAQSAKHPAFDASGRLDQIARILWLATEKVDAIHQGIDQSADALAAHVVQRRAA